MPVSMNLELGGMFEASGFAGFKQRSQVRVRQAVGSGMKTGGKVMLEKVRAEYARSVKVAKKSFPKAIGIKLYDRKPNELPALLVGSRVPAIAAHAFGANIPGPVLLPLLDNGVRIGRKRFSLLVRGLMSSGNAEFRRVHGKTILFAEAGAARQSGLNIGAFRRAERVRRGGKFRKVRGKALEVPIAVLVRNVVVKQSFPFMKSVMAGLPDITVGIQAALDKRN